MNMFDKLEENGQLIIIIDITHNHNIKGTYDDYYEDIHI